MPSGCRAAHRPPPPTDRTFDALLARADEKCAAAKSAVLEGAWLSLADLVAADLYAGTMLWRHPELGTTVDVARLLDVKARRKDSSRPWYRSRRSWPRGTWPPMRPLGR
jgi:glutathione S-transferase